MLAIRKGLTESEAKVPTLPKTAEEEVVDDTAVVVDDHPLGGGVIVAN